MRGRMQGALADRRSGGRVSLDKTPVVRDLKYLAWVRSQPSCISGKSPCVAHHIIGQRWSQAKSSDTLAIPLTDAEHKKLHESWTDWEAMHGSQWMHAARTLNRAIAGGYQFAAYEASPRKLRAQPSRGTALTTSKNLPRRNFCG